MPLDPALHLDAAEKALQAARGHVEGAQPVGYPAAVMEYHRATAQAAVASAQALVSVARSLERMANPPTPAAPHGPRPVVIPTGGWQGARRD